MSANAASRALPFRLNVEEAFRFLPRDRNWTAKLALGALFSFLSIVLVGAVLVGGYVLTFMERVARAEPEPLPEWGDWAELLRKGVIVILVNLVYSLPMIVVFGLVFVGNLALPLAASGLSSSGASGASGALFAGWFALTMVGYGVGFLLSLASAALLPAAHAQLALHDADFGAAFRPGEVFGFIRRYPGQYAVAVLLSFAARMLLTWVGYLACCVGVFVTEFFAQLFLAHMIGQLCWNERLTGGLKVEG